MPNLFGSGAQSNDHRLILKIHYVLIANLAFYGVLTRQHLSFLCSALLILCECAFTVAAYYDLYCIASLNTVS